MASAGGNEFGWAIVGPGSIAGRFAEAVTRLPDTRLVCVQGRDRDRAAAFAQRWDPTSDIVATTSLDQVLADPRVHGVYVATPHGFHAEAVRACLRAGKPVLCEKPLTTSVALAEELVQLSRERGVFLMEALWTRFLPIYAVVGEWLASGAIGPLRAIQSSFSFNVPFDPHSRMFDPVQGGGAVLDIGVYNLSVTQWCLQGAFGACPPLQAIEASGVLAPTGVEQRAVASLRFSGGVVSQLLCGFDTQGENALRLFGEKGVITLPTHFWEATRATLRLGEGELLVVDRAFPINGFEGQVLEAMACIRRGAIESPVMPHADTLQVMQWMERIRTLVGVAPARA